VFGGGAVVLLTLLLAQLAVVFRTELISRWPNLRPTLSQLCEVAGCHGRLADALRTAGGGR